VAKTLHHSLIVVGQQLESMHGTAGTPTGEIEFSPASQFENSGSVRSRVLGI
jgi:hypothetical protein